MANTIGTLNLLQSIVDNGLEIEKLDTAGTSEEYGNVRDPVRHHHDFDEGGGLILHERSPINPKSIYATSKVAADFLTMNFHDAFGLPTLVTRMFNNYGPRQNPRYVTGTIITQALERERIELGQLEPMRDFCFCTDGVRGHLTVTANGIPGDVYVYGQGENISMRDWCDLILRVGEEEGYWTRPRGRDGRRAHPPGRQRGHGTARRLREAARGDRLGAEGLLEEGVSRTIAWYAANRDRWLGRVDWLQPERQPRAAMSVLVTGGGGFLGSHVVERLRADGAEPFVARKADYDLVRADDAARLFDDARPRLVLHLAAEVGGIGANMANGGRYWYANTMMGANVLEQSRLHAVDKLIIVGTICSYPKLAPRPFREETSGTAIRRRRTRATASRSGPSSSAASLPRAVRAQHRPPAPGQPLRPARRLRPRALARHSGPDPEDARVAGRGRALGRRQPDPRVPLRRGRGRGDLGGGAAL